MCEGYFLLTHKNHISIVKPLKKQCLIQNLHYPKYAAAMSDDILEPGLQFLVHFQNVKNKRLVAQILPSGKIMADKKL